MVRYQSGDRAKKGYYLNLDDGALFYHENYGKLTPNTDGKFIRFPSAIALLGAPVVSLLYVVFLPLAGIAAVFFIIVYRVKNAVTARGSKRVSQSNP